MPKLTFVVGPIGGGIAELGGQLAQIYRNQPLPTTFDFPPEYTGGVLLRYVSEFAQGGIEESRHMCVNNLDFNFESYKTFFQNTLLNYETANHLVLGGTGLSLYIANFKNLYPDAEIVFVTRKISRDALEAIINHTTTPDMCWCGVEHQPLADAVVSYIENKNTSISNSIDAVVTELGYTWTDKITGGINNTEISLHNNANFMAPVMLAVYRPS
jgi:hypothetical protein